MNHVYKNSEFYRKRFDEAGVKPKHIKSLKDISKLPFTTAKDLQEGYPFPLRSVPFEKIVRIHASSGTTGKRKVLCYTQKDINDWANMFARCYEMAGLTRKTESKSLWDMESGQPASGFSLGANDSVLWPSRSVLEILICSASS